MSTVTDVHRFDELAVREQPGITVRLLWDRPGNTVWLSYSDLRENDAFATAVPAARALEAFRHPNAYRPRRHARTEHDRP